MEKCYQNRKGSLFHLTSDSTINIFFYQWKCFSFKKTVYELYRVTNSQKFSEFMRRYRKLYPAYVLRKETRFKGVLRFAKTLLKRERGTQPPNILKTYRKDFGTGN